VKSPGPSKPKRERIVLLNRRVKTLASMHVSSRVEAENDLLQCFKIFHARAWILLRLTSRFGVPSGGHNSSAFKLPFRKACRPR